MTDSSNAPDNYPDTVLREVYAELVALSNNLDVAANANDDERLAAYAELIEKQANQLEELDNDLERLNTHLQSQGDWAGDYITAASKLREVLERDNQDSNQ